MELNKELVIESFIEEADKSDSEWWYGSITCATNPAINFSLHGKSKIFKKDGTESRALSFFMKAQEHLKEFFGYCAAREIANEIELQLENKAVVQIITRWNPEIIEQFENNLPKSKKGKIKPWYKDAQ